MTKENTAVPPAAPADSSFQSVARPSSTNNPRDVDNRPAWMTKENTLVQVEPVVETIPPPAGSTSLEDGEIKESSQKGGSNRVKKLSSKIVLG